jgi:hypothetical protein
MAISTRPKRAGLSATFGGEKAAKAANAFSVLLGLNEIKGCFIA